MKVLLVLLLSALPVLAANPVDGAVALRQATQLLGTQPRQGQTAGGKPCTLTPTAASNGKLLGVPVLASYVLTVTQASGPAFSTSFYFIPRMTLTPAGSAIDFTAPQSYDDEDPETGRSRGTVDATLYMRIAQVNGALQVSIKNGPVVACLFR